MRIIIISCFLIFSILSLIGNEDLSFIVQFHAEKDNSKLSKLILFEEHFENDQNIRDTDIWELCTYANNAWSQHFKDVKGYENVKVEDGYLKLRATKDGDNYKNAGIRTKKGFPNNTRVEVKARLKSQVRGGFPAIWQMPIGEEE